MDTSNLFHMPQRPLTPDDLKPRITSKVKFGGDFGEELKSTIASVVDSIEKNLVKKLAISSLSTNNYSIKLWIDDDERFIHRILNVIFRYDANNKKFGYCNIELHSTETSKKARLHYVGKFAILDRNEIVTAICTDIERSLEEIY